MDPELDPDNWEQIGTEFQPVFGVDAKHWYDCREEGRNQDGTRVWWS